MPIIIGISIFLPVIIVLLTVFVRIAQPLFTKMQEKMDYLNRSCKRTLRG